MEEKMMNKNMVLCIYLVMGFLLYDLYFDIIMAILRVYLVFADFFNFPWPFKTTMCSLYPFEASKIFRKTIDSLTGVAK